MAKIKMCSVMKSLILMTLAACTTHKPESPLSTQRDFSSERPTHRAEAQRYAVASQGEATSAAAIEMFRAGGNIIDAFAAASFTISVERPHSTGIGGGGFLLYREPKSGRVHALDFRERAPLKATATMFLDEKGEVIPKKSLEGVFASAVPGLVAGVLQAHEKFGKLPRAKVLEPAIRLAEKGMKVYPELGRALAETATLLAQTPSSKAIFFKDEAPLKEGDTLIQADLAKTLRLIARDGAKAFYRGPIAKALVKQQQELGGLISHKDLQSYAVKSREPVRGKFLSDYEIFSMPPPSSGGIHVMQVLNAVEQNAEHHAGGPLAFENVWATASALQMAFADRARFLGDPDFVKVPMRGLIDKRYAQKRWAEINAQPGRARASSEVAAGDPMPYESPETTHFSIIDAEGGMVASTQTINGWFGSGLVVPGTGIVMNNEMDDLSTKPGAQNLFGAVGSEQNAVAPGKRPLSSMSPTLVLRDQKPLLALGSPSGTRIISCVALVALNATVYKQPLFEAVSALRYHHQWQPDELRVEEPGFDPALRTRLEAAGFKVKNQDLGCRVQAVGVENGALVAVSDPRGQGRASAE